MKRVAPILLVAVLFVSAISRDLFDTWVAQTAFPVLALDTSVEVRDRQGELLRAYTVSDGLWRLNVSADQVDSRFVKGLIAYEDKRFFHHNGVDVLSLARAAGQAVWHQRIVSGGSTLTMQVARLLESSGTGRWPGKLRQMRLALALERRLTKIEILNLYLMLAPYGGNIEGIRAASLAYFGKEPVRLTPAQTALLIGLPQSPEARRPDRNVTAAKAARDRVLMRLARTQVISDESARGGQAEPMPRSRREFPALAPHLADRVIAQDPMSRRHSLTLDARLQKTLEELAKNSLQAGTDRQSIAIVVADHQTGAVLASVGSAGYGEQSGRQGYVDMTRALRSPGSTLKPLIYALAFDRGLAHPETLIDDRPIAFGAYAPQNFDGQFRGEVRVADALRLSLNIPVVALTEELGPAHLMAALHRAGATPESAGGKPGLAIALGGLGISLEDLVQLYAALARGGEAVNLHWQKDDPGQNGARVVSRSSAWQVGHILAGLTPPKGAPLNRLAYKTGTSYGHRDAWALGYDGRHVVGVWIGRPDGTPVPGAFGADNAAPVLFDVFQRLKPALDPLSPPPPETLIVSTANLPLPLQRFRGRNAVFKPDPDAPQVAFPPDGARLALSDGHLTVKVRDGQPPFTWLANGMPVLTNSHRREATLPRVSGGFVNLSVIDARGRAARAEVRID